MTRTKPRGTLHHGFRVPGLLPFLVLVLLTYSQGFWIGGAGFLAVGLALAGLQRWIEHRFIRSVHRWAWEQGLADLEPPLGPGFAHYACGLWTFSDERSFRARRANGAIQEITASYYAPLFGLYLDVMCGWS